MEKDGRFPSYPKTQERRYDLDNLRTFLTALTIVHHTAIAYGGVGGWKYRCRCLPSLSISLATFNGINQTFFMGTFFYLSGYFARRALLKSTPYWSGSWNRKFIHSRLVRLLLPAFLYTFLAEPMLELLFEPEVGSKPPQFLPDTSNGALPASIYHAINFAWIKGPVWYLALLTIFDTLASLIPPHSPFQPTHLYSIPQLAIYIITATAIISSYLIRLVYPIGTIFKPLNILPGYLPQYILAYSWGHVACLNPSLTIFLPFPFPHRPVYSLLASLALSLLSLGVIFGLTIALSSDPLTSSSTRTAIITLTGGPTLPAFLYALWNELSFITITPALLSVFSRCFNAQFCLEIPSLGHVDVARYSYAAFLVHAPVSLAVEVAVDALGPCRWGEVSETAGFRWLGPGLMTLGIGMVNVVASWWVGWGIVRWVPWVGRII